MRAARGRRSPAAGMRSERGRSAARIAAAIAVRSQRVSTTPVDSIRRPASAEPVCIERAMTTTSRAAEPAGAGRGVVIDGACTDRRRFLPAAFAAAAPRRPGRHEVVGVLGVRRGSPRPRGSRSCVRAGCRSRRGTGSSRSSVRTRSATTPAPLRWPACSGAAGRTPRRRIGRRRRPGRGRSSSSGWRLAQQAVAFVVAVPCVEVPEVVEVDEDQRQRLASSACARAISAASRSKRNSRLLEPGERVDRREALDGAAQAGDVQGERRSAARARRCPSTSSASRGRERAAMTAEEAERGAAKQQRRREH